MPGIRHRTTVYPGLGNATPHVAQVQDGNMFVEFGPDDTLSVVGPPERLVRWAKEFIAAVEDAEMEAGIDAAFDTPAEEDQETRHYKAALITEGDTILCPDGEYRTVKEAGKPIHGKSPSSHWCRTFWFTDGTGWRCNAEDTVPVVIRTAERSA